MKHRIFLKRLNKTPQNFFTIHYACQSFSSGITSIAIKNYNTAKTYNYSIYAIAKERDIKEGDIKARFDEIELELLCKFFEFIKKNKYKYWVHWNMRDQGFGFEHLEHRYFVLAKDNAPEIPAGKRINLNDMLENEHGSDYAGDPRMSSLMKINGRMYRNFLEGEEEVQAFNAGEFDKIERSTSAKVGFFGEVMRKMTKGELKTAHRELKTENRELKTENRRFDLMILIFFKSHRWQFAVVLLTVILGVLGALEDIRNILYSVFSVIKNWFI